MKVQELLNSLKEEKVSPDADIILSVTVNDNTFELSDFILNVNDEKTELTIETESYGEVEEAF
jgi:hypothetical protein